MHNPPHPGFFIRETYMEPHGVSCHALAQKLGMDAAALERVLNGEDRVSLEIAVSLSKALGRIPESWLAMQKAYDLWHSVGLR